MQLRIHIFYASDTFLPLPCVLALQFRLYQCFRLEFPCFCFHGLIGFWIICLLKSNPWGELWGWSGWRKLFEGWSFVCDAVHPLSHLFCPPAGLLAWSLCRRPPITSQPTLSSPCRQNHFPATETQMLSIWLNVQGYISKYIKVCLARPSVEAWQTVFVLVCTVQVQAALGCTGSHCPFPYFLLFSYCPIKNSIFWPIFENHDTR